jgi:hypothetical protein
VRSPFAALAERLRRRPAAERPRASASPTLPEDMDRGAPEFQRRLDEARERLRRDIPPPPDDDTR